MSEYIKNWGNFNNNYYVEPNYPMPDEFVEISRLNDADIRKWILKTNKVKYEPFRFSNVLGDYLKYSFQGHLPKDLYSLAGVLGFPEEEKDLFRMDESEFKVVHKDFYDSLYNNLSLWDKKKVFKSADCGRRSVFQLEQDTVASNVFEKMIWYYSGGRIDINPEASHAGDISTKADFVFKSFKNETIWTYLELKTSWSKSNNTVSFRGDGYERLKRDKAVTLAINMDRNNPTAVVIDMSNNKYPTRPIYKGGKEYTELTIPEEEFIPFRFWDLDNMKEVLRKIYEICISR